MAGNRQRESFKSGSATFVQIVSVVVITRSLSPVGNQPLIRDAGRAGQRYTF